MNRSEYEKIHGKPTKPVCKACQMHTERKRIMRLERHRRNKEKLLALKRGIESGKVIPVWHRDEFTGWHYVDWKGRCEITGPGDY